MIGGSVAPTGLDDGHDTMHGQDHDDVLIVRTPGTLTREVQLFTFYDKAATDPQLVMSKTGAEGNDTMLGGDGEDVVHGRPGNDLMNGMATGFTYPPERLLLGDRPQPGNTGPRPALGW